MTSKTLFLGSSSNFFTYVCVVDDQPGETFSRVAVDLFFLDIKPVWPTTHFNKLQSTNCDPKKIPNHHTSVKKQMDLGEIFYLSVHLKSEEARRIM